MKNKFFQQQPAGLSLIEAMIAISVIGVAMLATLSTYARYLGMKNVIEQRRQATLAAEQKLDEIRSYIGRVAAGNATDPSGVLVSDKANPLDAVYVLYGPSPLTGATGALNRPCCFSVPNLNPIGAASVGTVTIINSETPDATKFGYTYDGSASPKIFCVNLYGNNYPDGGFPLSIPPQAPFPLDLDGDGLVTASPPNLPVVSNFCLLPIVVTIRWLGSDGNRQRVDLFEIFGTDQGQK